MVAFQKDAEQNKAELQAGLTLDEPELGPKGPDCLHEKLDRMQPDYRSGVHGLVCNCPKCSIRC